MSAKEQTSKNSTRWHCHHVNLCRCGQRRGDWQRSAKLPKTLRCFSAGDILILNHQAELSLKKFNWSLGQLSQANLWCLVGKVASSQQRYLTGNKVSHRQNKSMVKDATDLTVTNENNWQQAHSLLIASIASIKWKRTRERIKDRLELNNPQVVG